MIQFYGVTLKYLGINFVSEKKIVVDVNPVKRKFFMSYNSILNNSTTFDQLIQLHLQQAYALSILSYATAAVKLSETQLAELNACWASVY